MSRKREIEREKAFNFVSRNMSCILGKKIPRGIQEEGDGGTRKNTSVASWLIYSHVIVLILE